MKKRCITCGRRRQLDNFHRDAGAKDGRTSSCKKCATERARAWSKAPGNRERHTRASRAWRAANPEMSKALIERQGRTPAARRGRANYRARNQVAILARRAVRDALRSGRMTRQPCERCGETKRVHAHHDDYSRPLDVTWLCKDHHVELHNAERQEVSRVE